MEEQIKSIVPLLEQWATLCEAEWRAAQIAAEDASEREHFYRQRSLNADQLLQDAKTAADGTYPEVPL